MEILYKSRVQSETKFHFWYYLQNVVSNHKIVQLCSGCRIRSDKTLPFKELNRSHEKKYTNKNCEKNDQKLFAVKIRNIADISNKRRKIDKSIISTVFFIKLNEFFVLYLNNEKLLSFE